MKVLLGLKRFDMLGLAETFLKMEEEEVSVTGYEWYGRNRDGGKRANGAWQCWYIRVWNRE